MLTLLLFQSVLLFQYCVSDSYVLSDGQLRIVSSSEICNIGIIEMNDYLKGWVPFTSIYDCYPSAIFQSFDSNIGDLICKQLGFNKLDSYQTIEANNFISSFDNGYNTIKCDQNVTNICQQCIFYNQNAIINDNNCDSKLIEIKCDESIKKLECVAMDQFNLNQDNNNNNNKCNDEIISSYNLASKPFYEDDTFILVVVIIGLVLLSCICVCIMNYLQTEYGNCMKCRKCILCVTCRCFGYEGDEPEPVPFDVSPQKKAKLKAAQRGFDEQTAYW